MGRIELTIPQGSQTARPLRLNQGELKILRPSFEAINLATLLGKPDDFLARMFRASRPFRFQRTAGDKESIQALRCRRGMPPGERDTQISAILKQSKIAQYEQWSADRIKAKYDWCPLVRLYVSQLAWFQGLTEGKRAGAAKQLETDFLRRNLEELRSEAKAKDRAAKDQRRAEEKARTAKRRELKESTARLRRQFGWRNRADGRIPWARYASDVCNPERYVREVYVPKTKQFWLRLYDDKPELLNEDQARVRKEVLRGHELSQPTGQGEWLDPMVADVLAQANDPDADAGMSTTHVDDLEPTQAVMNTEPKRKTTDADDHE